MLVRDILKGVEVLKLSKDRLLDLSVENISINTNRIKENSVYILISGSNFNPYEKIDEIYNTNKVKLFFSDRELGDKPFIMLNDCRMELHKICRNFFGINFDEMLMFGVTGTNGKTTTNYLLDSILKVEKRKTIRIGTTEYKIVDEVIEANNTTPGTYDIFELIYRGYRKGASAVCMEVSSHALDQKRVAGLIFDVAIFTNLTGDHLDYHKTMEEYYLAKKKLFTKGYSKNAVINIDYDYGKRLFEETDINKLSYSVEKGDIYPVELKFSLDGISAVISFKGELVEIYSSLVGRHNLENILAASSSAFLAGISLNSIKAGVESLKNVPGRLEKFEKDGAYFFVDYAHTDDALKNVLDALSRFKKSRLITVFGCGGDRDRTKRPRMARVAEKYSDIVIVTSDNPRTENPDEIINEILTGFESTKNVIVESDRRSAIQKAVNLAGSGDIVLIAGKGHEDYQIVGKTKYHFDDREEVCKHIGVRFEKD